MTSTTYLAAVDAGTQRTITISLFVLFVIVTLGITIWASRQTHNATDFDAGGRTFSGFQNGMAIGGDYMSAASFLGIAGIIA
ncbi:MAG: cation/acetate symporter, partial [Micromonosporaceae bacterium]|nr:cation/acetate symporter [Micromonosporaceae bacterium]